jgi:hypothetical protein
MPAEQTSDLEDEEIQIEEGDVLEVPGPVENYERPDKWHQLSHAISLSWLKLTVQ